MVEKPSADVDQDRALYDVDSRPLALARMKSKGSDDRYVITRCT